jgi:hypothetical protein
VPLGVLSMAPSVDPLAEFVDRLANAL